jgi:hypothetical protein
VLWGSASELERDLPFSVFVDALYEYLQTLEPGWFASLDPAVQTELAHVFPSLPALASADVSFRHERYRSHRAVRALPARDRIYNQIMQRGWNPSRRAFVQHYDTDVLDASLLLMPLCKFIAPTDPRWISTLDAITTELVSDSLVYRYNVDASPDGLAGNETTFSLCSFWWVDALARAGRLDDARLACRLTSDEPFSRRSEETHNRREHSLPAANTEQDATLRGVMSGSSPASCETGCARRGVRRHDSRPEHLLYGELGHAQPVAAGPVRGPASTRREVIRKRDCRDRSSPRSRANPPAVFAGCRACLRRRSYPVGGAYRTVRVTGA